jgi:hypothetical protein
VQQLGCGDKLFVSSQHGYSMLQLTSTAKLNVGDVLNGDVEKIGYVSLFDTGTGERFSAIVQEPFLSDADLASKVAITCRPPRPLGPAVAVVTRAMGCRTKLFVLAPNGYAMLDRLAGGGVVVKGDHLTGDFNKPGRAVMEDTDNHTPITVFVQDYMLSRSAVANRIAAYCRAEPEPPIIAPIPPYLTKPPAAR